MVGKVALGKVSLSVIRFYTINIISSWLSKPNRYQRVEIKHKHFSSNAFSDWGIIKHGVLQGLHLGPLLYLLSINDLSKTINKKSKPILFSVDTSIIFTISKSEDFKNDRNIVFESINK
jgi:hypothetical protein